MQWVKRLKVDGCKTNLFADDGHADDPQRADDGDECQQHATEFGFGHLHNPEQDLHDTAAKPEVEIRAVGHVCFDHTFVDVTTNTAGNETEDCKDTHELDVLMLVLVPELPTDKHAHGRKGASP